MEQQPHEMRELYERYKPLLFTLAYQITGSAVDAEDAVQDVFVKLHDLDGSHIGSPKAYLCKMVTNRALDLIKSARKRRELYFGTWLPEPLLTPSLDLSEAVAREELLSYAVLVLLERLSPSERVVFVLREALGMDYPTIAKITDKGEPNCRKLFSRAKLKLEKQGRELDHGVLVGEEWVRRFIEVLMKDDMEALLPLLAGDVTALSDGGGKVPTAVNPIEQPRNVARYLLGLMRKISSSQNRWRLRLLPLNGHVGIAVWELDTIDSVVLMDVANDVIKNLYIVRNPEKLRHLKG